MSRTFLALALIAAVAVAGYYYYQNCQNTIEIQLPKVKVNGGPLDKAVPSPRRRLAASARRSLAGRILLADARRRIRA